MPNACLVHASPHRAAIDALWLTGARTRHQLADEFGVPYGSMVKHLRSHVPVAPPRAPAQVLLLPEAATPARPGPASPGTAAAVFRAAFGMEPLPWQAEYLAEERNTVVLKGRQVGATQACAALAVACAMREPGALAAVISPSLRQSTEVTLRARLGLWELGERLVQDSTSLLRLGNGSRVISLPGHARGIRGYPVDLLILDEAAWIEDATFTAARAMTAATGGRVVVQSTPAGPSGFFHELATSTPDGWALIKVRSDEVPTIAPEFLARERAEMSGDLYAQEYLAEFSTAGSINELWSEADWRALIRKPDKEG